MAALIPTIVQTIQCEAWLPEHVMIGDVRHYFVCPNTTKRGYYCVQHARSLLGLEVLDSTIPNAGKGLFATRPFRKGEIIEEYKGPIETKEEYDEAPSLYGLEISRGRVINPINSTDCFARYANDARSQRRNNSQFYSERKYGRELAVPRFYDGSGGVAFLVATKAIAAGEEIFAKYGGDYWG
jgi:hypothetical protein